MAILFRQASGNKVGLIAAFCTITQHQHTLSGYAIQPLTQRILASLEKGRLETINVDFTDENTTWFKRCRNSADIEMITDYNNEDLLIKEYGCSPVES
ncbi:MAG: hypothetical protein FP810_02400 [Desulfocapsa sp.]|nr:hypothetical protein [Desulfocapsa sp.]MBU3943191.1 hypothetical protein [Pseudomonadota bacterium]MCG2745351.1 hypothetical protein [Desulfobacteraceae bacterium]